MVVPAFDFQEVLWKSGVFLCRGLKKTCFQFPFAGVHLGRLVTNNTLPGNDHNIKKGCWELGGTQMFPVRPELCEENLRKNSSILSL